MEHTWSPAVPASIECVQVVFKVAERCNINCSYCYYFNMGESSALDRPALATGMVAERLSDWLVQGCTELRIPAAAVSFHGGEPMLLGAERFSEMCTILRRKVSHVADLSLSIQTNGTLLDAEWLTALREHRVDVGVSVDGLQEDNDRHRLDFNGRSTFLATEAALKSLVAEACGDERRLPSTISVVHPDADYRAVYAYLRALGVQRMDFLLPDRSARDEEFRKGGEATRIGRRLLEVFDSWLVEDDLRVRIRFIDRAIRHFQAGCEPGPVSRPRKNVQVLVVQSDGGVTVDDSYIPALQWYRRSPTYSLLQHSMRDVLSDPIFLDIEAILRELPRDCRSCRWRAPCGGGDLENRYRPDNGFDNPSIYCDSYKVFYEGLSDLLVRNGYPASEVERRFAR